MIFLLDFYDISVGLLWGFYWIPLGFPLYIYDISMGFLLDLHGGSLEFLQDFTRMTMGLLYIGFLLGVHEISIRFS